MKAEAKTKDPNADHAAALETLHHSLEHDMQSVNEAILAHLDSPVSIIPQVARHLIAAGGKRIRPLLTLAATEIYGGDMRRAHVLSACVEFIHSATLLHDDVVDESALRRGLKTANIVFGNKTSVLVGDFLFSRAFQMMVGDGNIEILRVLSDASAVIAQGEVMQLGTANNPAATIDDYLNVIRAKTAALFAAACEVGPMIAEAGPEAAACLAEYGMNLGIAFQIADDVLDYGGSAARMGKSVGDDFYEGKMTAPVIFALQKSDTAQRRFWEECLTQPARDEAKLGRAQDFLHGTGALTASRELAHDFAQKARLALAEAPDHPLRAALDALALHAALRAS